jgi:hypothetical protein
MAPMLKPLIQAGHCDMTIMSLKAASTQFANYCNGVTGG